MSLQQTIRWHTTAAVCGAIIGWFWPTHAHPHDIYTGVHGKNGQLCCGGDDCALTIYREHGENFDFLTREKTWVTIPKDRITFLPIPGENLDTEPEHSGHLCYRHATDNDRLGYASSNVFGDILFYCAFIPPGSI